MERIQTYFRENSEQVHALAIMWCVVGVTFFLPYKLTFLNVFFPVILVATYYLETRKAILGSVFAVLLVIVYVYYFPSYFILDSTPLDLWMVVLAWSSILILTGAVVGKLTSQLKHYVKRLEKVNRELWYAETKVLRPARQLKRGQMVSVSPQDTIQLAAVVTKISDNQIEFRLAKLSTEHPIQKGEQVRIKCWDLDEAIYFDSEVLQVSVSGAGNDQFEISEPREGVALQRRKIYRVHDPIPLSFTIIDATETQIIGEEILDAKIKDFTLGGLAFETDLPLKAGNKLDMNLRLSSSKVVNAVGSVLRSSQRDEESLYTVAVKFFQLDREDQNTLLLFLSESRTPDETLDALWLG